MNDFSNIVWRESDVEQSARWHSEKNIPPPKRIQVIDDTITANDAYRLACEGTGLLWRGDFQNARQLLNAIAKRIDKKNAKKPAVAVTSRETFNLYRQAQSQRARTLDKLLIPFEADHRIPLRRAPDVHSACTQVYGENHEPYVISLRELLGLIGAHEWRKKGVDIAVLNGKIHPHYGVFAPIRQEYLQLIAETPLPSTITEDFTAFDIGTGTGVIAALLAQQKIQHIIATDQDSRSVDCARENIARLGLQKQVQIVQCDLFPKQQQADLIVCNPPWIPARPSSPLEHAIYDLDNRMLSGFLNNVGNFLKPKGEAWLIMSDFAEQLGLRTQDQLVKMIKEAGLNIVEKRDIKPSHPRSSDTSDPLYAARKSEVVSLWRFNIETKN
ncbi:MAG TPA: class I SAM-dependent methyltransferase [Nitrosomonas sp.]|nr:class I SAM-dependent methyltransferase [Nitrosomonas sp.]HQX14348.1 class I SAM-dependent methyltransferase [Nitrosomonas sp.]HRB33675.1 class I SAM-dependent methyltransferase [Nitrosomonas sp.]HRB46412.1 class I SAM-dependent methyltransferase [Nitrosomonas sp.]HRB78276.1 class I SAM-dependent methyltransferase [Nitrosomonas sp.]